MTSAIKTDVLIVGGGLSGLRLADLLTQSGRDYHLIDARDRFGGRIACHQAGDALFDLGPAWFWPGQPRMAALTRRFGLEVFEQYASGDFRFEQADGRIQQGGGSAMQGSLRIDGGMAALVGSLTEGLAADRLHRRAAAVSCTQQADGILVRCADGRAFSARTVVLALPPRLAAGIAFAPSLPAPALRMMSEVPTWMAGQAKALLLYDTPFWREAGLSGDAMSHRGPLVEIHDATPLSGGPAALFGFVGVPVTHRTDAAALREAARAQITRLFGPDAPAPKDVVVQDWATDPATATPADHAPLRAHPRYGLPPALQGLWDDHLLFAGSEVAPEFGGYLEGALEAAEAAAANLAQIHSPAC